MSADGDREILHVDMDAFYASVEQCDHPELRGKPLMVGGVSGRGVVAAASYEVRKFGVRSAMPIRRALALCPDAVCVRPRMARYAEVSAQVFSVFHEFTPLVEGLSLDEAYLDVTGSRTLKGDALHIARDIKQRILEITSLTASVGVASNKLVAKIASDLHKPDGLTVVPKERIHEVLDPLPVNRLPGLGRKLGDRVFASGLSTLGALRRAEDEKLRSLFGRHWQSWRDRASGLDDREVEPDHDEKSVSNERTFSEDLRDVDLMKTELSTLADKVAARLRAKDLKASCIGIKVRLHDFTTLTRQCTLTTPSFESRVISGRALALFEAWLTTQPRPRIRLLGVSSSDFDGEVQTDLFAEPARQQNEKLDATLDAIRGKFGGTAVSRASILKRRR
ncbi:MAG: DNA polymerase IV [Gammaproteobacteria bacterium]|nr:DNA polymerase IV [Gammaproteobacteria bacterium]